MCRSVEIWGGKSHKIFIFYLIYGAKWSKVVITIFIVRRGITTYMLMGRYQNSIDAKNRVIIPAKFRRELNDSCVITKGLDNCLVIYTDRAWQRINDDIDKLPRTSDLARRYERFVLQFANDVPIDGQGRVLIPAELKDMVGIRKDLITIGLRDHIEIWAKEVYDNAPDGKLLTADNFNDLSEKYNI